MHFVYENELGERCYILAGKKGFFHTYCDFEFRTKWTGFWCGSRKFLDYIAFKVNDRWLSGENCRKFKRDNTFGIHTFSLDKIEAREKVFVPEYVEGLIIVIELRNITSERIGVELSLECGVNIRDYFEGWHQRTYDSKFESNQIVVTSSKGCVVFGSDRLGKKVLESYYREHWPSGERQRCFVPGIYSAFLSLEPKESKEVYFIFSFGLNEPDTKSKFYSLLTSTDELFSQKKKVKEELQKSNLFSCPFSQLETLFKVALMNLDDCAHFSKRVSSFFAGYPWYTQFWGRDLGWTLQGAVNCGSFDLVRSSLRFLARNQSQDGLIPNLIDLDGRISYNSADSTPLWLIALGKYIRYSASVSFLEEIRENFVRALAWYRNNSNEHGFVKSKKFETWMDTAERDGTCLEIQTLWFKGLKASSSLLYLLGDYNGSKLANQSAEKLKRNIRKYFLKSGLFLDILGKEEITINSIFPVLFGIANEETIERMEGLFFTKYGVSCLPKCSPAFNPAGYHTGSSWGLAVGLFACAEFKLGRVDQGLRLLNLLKRVTQRYCVASLPETWNSETGDIIVLKPLGYEPGAYLQAWTAASVINAIDEFMLGIELDAINRSIYLSPAIPNGEFRRRKRIANDWIDLTIKRKGERVSADCRSLKGIRYKVVMIPKV